MVESVNPEIFRHLFSEANNITKEKSPVWAIKPDPFDVFIKDHLGLPPLSERQYQDLTTFFGSEPERVFEGGSPYNLLCLLAGKGSGKDYMASILITYCFYIMLCMKDPQAYFGFPAGEAIDMVVVSYSADQALYISFDKIKQRFKNWFWLKNNFTVVWGEKFVSNKGKPEIYVHNGMIRSHNNVRIMSEHSANESFEGYNVIFFIMSEASAFKSQTKERNGEKVLNTLKTSAASRFPGRWKGLVMSFPRYDKDTDFTWVLYERALRKNGLDEDTGCTIMTSRGASWDFKPSKYYSGKTFRLGDVVPRAPDHLVDIMVPVEHKEDFESDPEDAMRKYLCEPPAGGSRVIPDDVIIKSVHSMPPLITAKQYVENRQVRVILDGLSNRHKFSNSYLLSIDLGESFAATAMALQHLDAKVGYVLDALWAWTPNPDKGLAVDLLDVKARIFEVVRTIPNIKVGFDQWQSLPYLAELRAAGVKTIEYHTYKERDYGIFRKAMAAGVVKIINPVHIPEFVTQLQAIKEVDGQMVLDRRVSARKDLVDAVVGGFMVLMQQVKETSLPGYAVRSNLDEFGTTIEER